MSRLARSGSQDFVVRNKAVELTNSLQQKDFTGEARRLLGFVRDEIRYVLDIDGVETLHTPAIIMQIGAGDCDDKAILLAALLLSIGHTPRFIAMGTAPERWEHVWVQDLLDGKWVDLEPTEPIGFGSSVPTRGAALMTYDIAPIDDGVSLGGFFSTVLNVAGSFVGDPALGDQLASKAQPGYAPITQDQQQIAQGVASSVKANLQAPPTGIDIDNLSVSIAQTIAPNVAQQLASEGVVFPKGSAGEYYAGTNRAAGALDAFGGEHQSLLTLAALGIGALVLARTL